MAYTFREAVDADGGDASWEVASCGTGAGGEQHMCAVAAGLINATPDGATFADAQRSTPARREDLQAQDIILVATRAERARVATMSPESRPRTFTLREAIKLGARPATSEELQALPDAAAEGTGGLWGYAALLHRRRGLEPMPTRRTGWLSRFFRKADPLDIPDVHRTADADHLRVLAEARKDVRTLHQQLMLFVGTRSSADQRTL